MVYIDCIIRAFIHACQTTRTVFSVYLNDTVTVFKESVLFAGFNAWCMVTMVTEPGQKEFVHIRVWTGSKCFDPAAECPERYTVFCLAADLAGITSDTPV
jgi:hypothetical protein